LISLDARRRSFRALQLENPCPLPPHEHRLEKESGGADNIFSSDSSFSGRSERVAGTVSRRVLQYRRTSNELRRAQSDTPGLTSVPLKEAGGREKFNSGMVYQVFGK